MSSLLIITQQNEIPQSLLAQLGREGVGCSVTPYSEEIREEINRKSPDALLLEIGGELAEAKTRDLIGELKRERPRLVTVLIIPEEMLAGFDSRLEFDDFVLSSCKEKELVLRVKRLLKGAGKLDSNEIIRCNGLVIDSAKCEVTVKGRIVELTFKEYELLKFLARNRGRVFTREALLNKVWKYDYFGGDRTVDVHIRRLRSKIEPHDLKYIETIRNIGYRFKAD